jgi:Protein of unknown function (DUF3341)
MAKPKKQWGVLARYDNPAEIYEAAKRVREAGYAKWDCCVPFPVHGLDKVMAIKASPLPWFVFAIGITGSLCALAFEMWTMGAFGTDKDWVYPFILAGKPLNSLPAFVPVWYACTILSSCLTIFFGNWFLCRLPQMYHPVFKSAAFGRATDDKFFIVIEASDSNYDAVRTKALLQDTGASLIEDLED